MDMVWEAFKFTMDLVFFCIMVGTLLFVAYVFIVFIGAVIMSIPTWIKRIWRKK